MYGKNHAITHSGLKKAIYIEVKTAQKKSAFEPTFHIVLIIIINDDIVLKMSVRIKNKWYSHSLLFGEIGFCAKFRH